MKKILKDLIEIENKILCLKKYSLEAKEDYYYTKIINYLKKIITKEQRNESD